MTQDSNSTEEEPVAWMRRAQDRVQSWTPPPSQGRAGVPPAVHASKTVVTARSTPAPRQDPVPSVEAQATAQATTVDDESNRAPVSDGSSHTPESIVSPQPAADGDAIDGTGPLEARIAELEHELATNQMRYHRSAEELTRAAFELSLRVDRDVVRLARRLAEVILKRVITLDSNVIIGSLRAAFAVSGPLEKVTVRCARRDAPTLREAAAEIATDLMGRWIEVAVQPSEDIEPGGLMLLFEEGVVDAQIGSQLDRLTEVVERAIGAQAYDSPGPERADTPRPSVTLPPPDEQTPVPASGEGG